MKSNIANKFRVKGVGPGGWKCTCCGPAPKHRASWCRTKKRAMIRELDPEHDYLKSFREEIARLTALLDDGPWRTWKHRPGGVYLLRGDRMTEAERLLLPVAVDHERERRDVDADVAVDRVGLLGDRLADDMGTFGREGRVGPTGDGHPR